MRKSAKFSGLPGCWSNSPRIYAKVWISRCAWRTWPLLWLVWEGNRYPCLRKHDVPGVDQATEMFAHNHLEILLAGDCTGKGKGLPAAEA